MEQFANLNELATVAQPLGLAMIAAFVREHGFSVAIIDAEAHFWTTERTVDEIEKYDPMLIGLSAFTTKMTAAGKILRLIKKRMPDVKTVIGGHHPSALLEQTLNEEIVDWVVKGEGYYPIIQLLGGIKDAKDRIVPNRSQSFFSSGEFRFFDDSEGSSVKSLDDLPCAAWDLLPMDKYRAHHWQTWDYNLEQSGFALIYTSLGCPFNCQYCSVNVVYGSHKVRYRNPKSVAIEIALLVEYCNVKHIEIIDDTFTLNPKRVEAICDEIIALGLGDKVNMWCFARVDRVSPKLMEKMKKAGINWVFMGFESGDDMVLQGVNKRQTVRQIREAVKVVHDAGIHIGGNYVFGMPNDTQETMRETLDLAKELNTEYANFFVLMAYPGTELYNIAKEKGYPLPEKWGQYGFFAPDAVPMRNENLTAEDILTFRDNAFIEYFTNSRYQSMIKDKFGQNIVDFINNKVLSKKLVRHGILREP